MMSAITNPLVLRPMDILHFGLEQQFDPVGNVIEMIETNGQAATNMSIAVHTGLCYEGHKGRAMVAESLGFDRGVTIGGIRLSDDGKPRNLVGVTRLQCFDDPANILHAMIIIEGFIERRVKYDLKGVATFLNGGIHDDPSKVYCSEFALVVCQQFDNIFPTQWFTSDHVSPLDWQNFRHPRARIITGY